MTQGQVNKAQRRLYNIPREYYLKINIKINNCINSHLEKNPNAGKFQFNKIAHQNS